MEISIFLVSSAKNKKQKPPKGILSRLVIGFNAETNHLRLTPTDHKLLLTIIAN